MEREDGEALGLQRTRQLERDHVLRRLGRPVCVGRYKQELESSLKIDTERTGLHTACWLDGRGCGCLQVAAWGMALRPLTNWDATVLMLQIALPEPCRRRGRNASETARVPTVLMFRFS